MGFFLFLILIDLDYMESINSDNNFKVPNFERNVKVLLFFIPKLIIISVKYESSCEKEK